MYFERHYVEIRNIYLQVYKSEVNNLSPFISTQTPFRITKIKKIYKEIKEKANTKPLVIQKKIKEKSYFYGRENCFYREHFLFLYDLSEADASRGSIREIRVRTSTAHWFVIQ